MKLIKPAYFIVFVVLSLSIFTSCSKNVQEMPESNLIPDFDMQRFVGKWYEIARLPHKDEKNLEMITLTIDFDEEKGNYNIMHKSWNIKTAAWQEKSGRIWAPDSLQASCLRISYKLFFGGDFEIIDLDRKNYEWAFVKSNDLQTAWILAREKKVPINIIKDIAINGSNLGVSTQKLKRVYHDLDRLKKSLKKD
ncbi:MAG: lipocalin family protein [Candidatus Marinimicrobia bacterium]|nr:lipocalin family protein [Candidatus Neomarinimicrobiota bacterium]